MGGGGCCGFTASSLLVNLKLKSRNLNHKRKKQNKTSGRMVSYHNQPRSLKQRRCFGSLSSHVAGNVFILDTVFEVGASLK